MKKILAMFAVAAISLSLATPVFAKNGNSDKNEKNNRSFRVNEIFSKFKGEFKGKVENKNFDASQFLLSGTVGSTTSGSIVVNVKGSIHVPTLTNNLATVNVDANTKYTAEKNQTVTLADVKAGQQIVVKGTVSGTTLTAQMVHIMLPKGKAYGEVTAKTATSITVKNSVTGTTQTFTTDPDTNVKINGETKTTADVQVGDKGFVKFKTKISGMFAKVVNLFR